MPILLIILVEKNNIICSIFFYTNVLEFKKNECYLNDGKLVLQIACCSAAAWPVVFIVSNRLLNELLCWFDLLFLNAASN